MKYGYGVFITKAERDRLDDKLLLRNGFVEVLFMINLLLALIHI